MATPATEMAVPSSDAESADPAFTAIGARRNDLLAAAQRAVIDSPEALEKAADLTKMIKVAAKKSDDLRLTLVKPIKEHAARIDAMFKPIKDDLAKAETAIKNKAGAYMEEQRRIAAEAAAAQQRAREEAALRAAEAAQESGDQTAADQIIQQAAAAAPVEAEAQGVARGDFGGTLSTRSTTKHRVVDITKVPAEFLLVNDAAVRAAIRAAQKAAAESGRPFELTITGIEIYEDQTVVSR